MWDWCWNGSATSTAAHQLRFLGWMMALGISRAVGSRHRMKRRGRPYQSPTGDAPTVVIPIFHDDDCRAVETVIQPQKNLWQSACRKPALLPPHTGARPRTAIWIPRGNDGRRGGRVLLCLCSLLQSPPPSVRHHHRHPNTTTTASTTTDRPTNRSEVARAN